MKDFFGVAINKWEKQSNCAYVLDLDIPQDEMEHILILMQADKDVEKITSFKETQANITINLVEHESGLVSIEIVDLDKNAGSLLPVLGKLLKEFAVQSGYCIVRWNGIMQIINQTLLEIINASAEGTLDEFYLD